MGTFQPDEEFVGPYESVEDLPAPVKKLPLHRQEIWLAAFNNALQETGSQEAAEKIAWAEAREHHHDPNEDL